MSACAGHSESGCWAVVVAALACFWPLPVLAEAPVRVASMNLCTDQLAMLIAAPGQLVSVSYLASDPRLSAMVEEARSYPANHGGAEELFVLRPDVVLADDWSPAATVSMLQRIGIKVVQFTPGATLGDIEANILKMGDVLGREAHATALAHEFAARRAALATEAGQRPRAALYFANSYMAGVNSLSGRIIEAAGYDNVAGEAGLDWGGTLPLEELVMANPDLVIVGGREPGQSRGEEVLSHPALLALPVGAGLTDADWTCATPAALDAVERLIAVRKTLETAE